MPEDVAAAPISADPPPAAADVSDRVADGAAARPSCGLTVVSLAVLVALLAAAGGGQLLHGLARAMGADYPFVIPYLVFFVALVVSQLAVVLSKRGFSEVQWLYAEYVWLLLAAVGLIGAVQNTRNVVGNTRLEAAQARLERAKDRIDGPARSCTLALTGDPAAQAWCRRFASVLERRRDAPWPQLRSESSPIAATLYLQVRSALERRQQDGPPGEIDAAAASVLVDVLTSYWELEEAGEQLEQAQASSRPAWLEGVILQWAPVLLAIALALPVAKVTHQWRHLRARRAG